MGSLCQAGEVFTHYGLHERGCLVALVTAPSHLQIRARYLQGYTAAEI